MFELAPAVGMSGNYQIKKSLRFNSADSAYGSRNPSTTTNRKTWTWSLWIKRSALGTRGVVGSEAGGSANTCGLMFDSSDRLYWQFNNTTYNDLCYTNAVFRDLSAWYHIVWAVDTTQSTATNRSRLYVNGVEQSLTVMLNNGWPQLNFDTTMNFDTYPMRIGMYYSGNPLYFDGYASEINFIDGQQLTPSSFGKTDSVSGQWIPKKYNGTYGTNGFYLPFDDGTSTTTLGYDRSGNANNWTLTNFSVAAGVDNDWLDDTPTNNFCTLNQLDKYATMPITDGALKVAALGAAWIGARATQSIPASGKWYFEATPSSNIYFQVALAPATANVNGLGFGDAGVYRWDLYGGSITYGPTTLTSIAGNVATDVIGIAADADTKTISLYLNGVHAYTYTQTYSGDLFPAIWSYSTTPSFVNFGQRAFVYTPPTGFKSLCAKNLPTPTIKKPNKYFDVKTYIGNGSTNSITGLNFQPDLVWGKARSFTQSNGLYDSVRGVTKALYSDLTNAEATDVNALTSFNADGFSMGSSASLNQNAASYVAWNWKANGAAVANNNGSITSNVSANPTAGFSIVTYTGTGANATVGHGLGVAPSVVIVKNRSSASVNWGVWHSALLGTQFLNLNTTGGIQTLASVWNSTTPNNSVFSLGSDPGVNANTSSHVAYCFAEVLGYSKFGKYTGNGSADGPFVYCGFKPRFILIKRTDATATNWELFDTTRNPYNTAALELYPNSSSAENASSADEIDILSNGFKIRSTNAIHNTNGVTYIFMAFAEAPFKYSTAR